MANTSTGPTANTLAKYKTSAMIAEMKLKELTKPKKKPAKRKRRRKKAVSKGPLSQFFSVEQGRKGMSATVSGGVGGFATAFLDKIMSHYGATPWQQIITSGVLSIGTGAVLRLPNVGAGMMGATVYKMAKETGLAEGYEYTQEDLDALSDDTPMYLDENGSTMYLEDNNPMYLDDNEEDTHVMDVYPEYVNVAGYGTN